MKRVHANGLSFAYLEEGEGPLVLLVHGFPDTAHTWDTVRPALAGAGFRAVSPNTRGYAPTAIPADGRYDSDTLGADLVALVEALGEEQAIVVGHDWGASAVFSAATLAPERWRFVVTMAVPHPASMIPTPSLLWSMRHMLAFNLPGAVERARADDFAYIDELVQRWSPVWDVPEGETDHVKEAFRQPGCLDAALGYYRALRPMIPKAQRKRITVPAAAIAGTDDMISVEHFERARGRYRGDYQVARMPGGHFMHREHPERFNEELSRLLEPYRA